MLTTILAIFSALSLVRADPSYFIYPPASGQASSFAGNVQLQRGSEVNLNWYSNISSYTITLWQQAASNNGATNFGTVYQTTNGLGDISYNWTVDIFGSDLKISPVYFLWLNYGSAQAITTHYFNITAAAAKSSSVSSSATSTSATTTSSSTPSSTNTGTSSASSSSATAIGLGVGLGVGIPLLLLIAAFFGFRAWRNRRAAGKAGDVGGDYYGHDTKGYTAAPQYDQQESNPVYAMHGSSDIHEAPAQMHTGPVEVSGQSRAVEAPAEQAPIEMPAHSTQSRQDIL